MTLTSGFFNSLAGDRKYDAEQFSQLFQGIITDGVFASIGQKFVVTQATPVSMTVLVGSGRAWFRNIWANNDAAIPVVIETAHATLSRKDIIYLEVNSDDGVRACAVKVRKGTAAVTPVAPALDITSDKGEYLIATIAVGPGITELTQANITSHVGTSNFPYITGPLTTLSSDSIVAQWEAEFNDWFNSLVTNLEGDVAATLTSQMAVANSDIDTLQSAVAAIPKITSGTAAPSGGNDGDIYLRYE